MNASSRIPYRQKRQRLPPSPAADLADVQAYELSQQRSTHRATSYEPGEGPNRDFHDAPGGYMKQNRRRLRVCRGV
jgi:hypothetical protein